MYLQFLSDIYMHVNTFVRARGLKAINKEPESEINSSHILKWVYLFNYVGIKVIPCS